MKNKLLFTVFIILTGFTLVCSCKKDKSCANCLYGNKPPIANAGTDTSILLPTDSMLLDGSKSIDSDDGIVSFKWEKISGPDTFNIKSPRAMNTMVIKLVKAVYRFELTVTDKGGLTARDTVVITVKTEGISNRPPVANAGNDTTIQLQMNLAIILDGSKSVDPDNNIKNYAWKQISGPPASNISKPNSIKTEVSDLLQGIYQFELTVTDSGGLFSKDTMQVRFNGILYEACDNSIRPIIQARLVPVGTLSEARAAMTVASAGNKILFAGGLTFTGPSAWGSARVDIYDVVTQAWSVAELSESRSAMAAVAAGNKIFLAGGRYGDGAFDKLFSTVDIYDVSANTWTVASLSEPRSYIAGAAVGNRVFFAGGEKDFNYNTSNTVDIYDFPSNNWSTSILSENRAHISAVTADNKIYFAGGHVEDLSYSLPSRKIDIYDHNTNTWSTSSLLEAKGILAVIHITGSIYWAGGCTVEIKNINTGNTSKAVLFKPGGWLIDEGQNAVVKDNKIVFFTGNAGGNRFDIYNVTNNTWSIGELPVNIKIASVISVNNTIYVAGGYINDVLSNQVWKLEF